MVAEKPAPAEWTVFQNGEKKIKIPHESIPEKKRGDKRKILPAPTLPKKKPAKQRPYKPYKLRNGN